MVKLPCYLILCQCYLDTYNWCRVTLLPKMFFHCYLVTCPKYPMLPCYLKTVNRPHLSQYICLLDNTREHLRDPFFFWRGGLQTTPELRPVTFQSQTINILRTTSKIQATPLYPPPPTRGPPPSPLQTTVLLRIGGRNIIHE